MALNSLICADVPLRIYSFTHACDASTLVDELFIHSHNAHFTEDVGLIIPMLYWNVKSVRNTQNDEQ